MPKFNVHVTKKGYGWLFNKISAPTKSKAMRKAVDKWDYKMQNRYKRFFVKMLSKPYRVTVFAPNNAIHSMMMTRTNEQRLKEVV